MKRFIKKTFPFILLGASIMAVYYHDNNAMEQANRITASSSSDSAITGSGGQNSNNNASSSSPFNLQSNDVIVLLQIPGCGMSQLARHLVTDLITSTPCICPTEAEGKTRCRCVNTKQNTWLFQSFNSTGYVCGEQADWSTLTQCDIDRWMEDVGHDSRSLRRYWMLTLLREPSARFVHDWNNFVTRDSYFRNEPRLFREESPELQKKGGLECLLGKRISRLSLREYLDCRNNPAINRMTRMLANLSEVNNLGLAGDKYNDALFKSAKHNLDQLPFFGISERAKDTQLLFKSVLRLNFKEDLEFLPKNLYKQPSDFGISGALLRSIRIANHLDVRLYEYALGLFDKLYAETKNSAGISSASSSSSVNKGNDYDNDYENRMSDEDDENDKIKDNDNVSRDEKSNENDDSNNDDDDDDDDDDYHDNDKRHELKLQVDESTLEKTAFDAWKRKNDDNYNNNDNNNMKVGNNNGDTNILDLRYKDDTDKEDGKQEEDEYYQELAKDDNLNNIKDETTDTEEISDDDDDTNEEEENDALNEESVNAKTKIDALDINDNNRGGKTKRDVDHYYDNSDEKINNEKEKQKNQTMISIYENNENEDNSNNGDKNINNEDDPDDTTLIQNNDEETTEHDNDDNDDQKYKTKSSISNSKTIVKIKIPTKPQQALEKNENIKMKVKPTMLMNDNNDSNDIAKLKPSTLPFKKDTEDVNEFFNLLFQSKKQNGGTSTSTTNTNSNKNVIMQQQTKPALSLSPSTTNKVKSMSSSSGSKSKSSKTVSKSTAVKVVGQQDNKVQLKSQAQKDFYKQIQDYKKEQIIKSPSDQHNIGHQYNNNNKEEIDKESSLKTDNDFGNNNNNNNNLDDNNDFTTGQQYNNINSNSINIKQKRPPFIPFREKFRPQLLSSFSIKQHKARSMAFKGDTRFQHKFPSVTIPSMPNFPQPPPISVPPHTVKGSENGPQLFGGHRKKRYLSITK